MERQRRWKVTALLAAGIATGVVIVATPATGHVGGWKHNWLQHIKPKTDARYYTKQQANDRFRNHIPGGPLAGANIAANGTVRKHFNRRGGTPTVNKAGTGVYIITFPGLEGLAAYNNSVVAVSPIEGGTEISRDSSNGNAYVATRNSAGTAVDAGFDIVIFTPGPLLTARRGEDGERDSLAARD